MVNGMTSLILLILWIGAFGATVFALIHAVRQRSDAFTAVDKMTKPIWLAILGGALVFLLIGIGGLGCTWPTCVRRSMRCSAARAGK